MPSESNWTAGEDGILLKMTHYDFSVVHEDFTYVKEDYYSKPVYVASPYGSWLDIPDSRLSDWFHYVEGNNVVVDNALVLSYDDVNNVNRSARMRTRTRS